MAYFIFTKDLDNVPGTLYRIAENQSEFNNLNINPSSYKIIQDSYENFNEVKYGLKFAESYSGDIITFVSKSSSFRNKDELSNYIYTCLISIKDFTVNNQAHALHSKWDSYYNQLTNLNLDSITYPLKSLEQYFKDQNLPSLHPLQIP